MSTDQDSIEAIPGSEGAALPSLIASIRRLTIAVWCLVGVFVISYAAPWAFFLFAPRSDHSLGNFQSPMSSHAASPETEFDNDFYTRPPEQQVKRATVILLTKFQNQSGSQRETISEIVKRAPDVRFYYKVGDVSPMPASPSLPNCTDCESDGQVILLQGNPARTTVSYSYHAGQVRQMGMSLDRLRTLARQSLSSPAK